VGLAGEIGPVQCTGARRPRSHRSAESAVSVSPRAAALRPGCPAAAAFADRERRIDGTLC